MQFKVGDHVRRSSHGRRNAQVGRAGTVTAVRNGGIEVRWVGDKHASYGTYASCYFEKVAEKESEAAELLKVGDRIERHGDSFSSARVGRKGVVCRVSTSSRGVEQMIGVQWDGDTAPAVGSFDANKFHKLASPSVEEALAVLQAAGEVKFTPRFNPFTVNLNNAWDAVVYKDYVKVGCQTFDFKAIDRLYVAVQKAKAGAK